MKHFKLLLVPALLLLTACVGSVDDDRAVFPSQNYQAVILDRATFENSVEAMPAQSIVKSGKIYVKDQFLFINEVNKGFHVFDYQNPQNPQPLGFIQILGATDLAVRDNNIYINQAVDLVTLTYNPADNSLTVTKRNKNVFPQKVSPSGQYGVINPNEIIIDWILN